MNVFFQVFLPVLLYLISSIRAGTAGCMKTVPSVCTLFSIQTILLYRKIEIFVQLLNISSFTADFHRKNINNRKLLIVHF